jgi:TPR repeat protein
LAAYDAGDYETALQELRPLADQGNATAQNREAAEQGNVAAQLSLGFMHAFGNGAIQDYTEAASWFRLAAEQGDAGAQSFLGTLYANGNGVIQDYTEAASWFRLAAEQGDARAQTNLGLMYNLGNGVIQDYAEAVDWYRKAAEQGHARAQNNLGLMYGNGKGVIQDDVMVHMWLNISGANGHALGSEARGLIEQHMTREQIVEAQALARRCMASDYQDCGYYMAVAAPAIAQDYAEGEEALKAGDYDAALQFFSPLTEQGDARAQFFLGTLYADGKGVIQDNVIAYMWINIGGANGALFASDSLDLIEQFITREQIVEAQALARRCMASNYQDCG